MSNGKTSWLDSADRVPLGGSLHDSRAHGKAAPVGAYRSKDSDRATSGDLPEKGSVLLCGRASTERANDVIDQCRVAGFIQPWFTVRWDFSCMAGRGGAEPGALQIVQRKKDGRQFWSYMPTGTRMFWDFRQRFLWFASVPWISGIPRPSPDPLGMLIDGTYTAG